MSYFHFDKEVYLKLLIEIKKKITLIIIEYFQVSSFEELFFLDIIKMILK